MRNLETHTGLSIPEVAKNLVDNDPSVRVVGSLGRYSIMGLDLSEFRKDGSRRDIDYFNLTEGNQAQAAEYELDDVRLDRDFNKWIRTEANGTYLVHPDKESLNVEVKHPEEVFAPYTATQQGLDIVTLRPEVLGKLHYMKGLPRPKDRVSAAEYDAYLDSSAPNNALSKELLDPFDQFSHLATDNNTLRIRSRLRNGYYRVMPEQLRKRLKISRFL